MGLAWFGSLIRFLGLGLCARGFRGCASGCEVEGLVVGVAFLVKPR